MARTEQDGKSSSSHLQPFEHTHLGVYFVGAFSMLCSSYDSFQGIVDKYHINKHWYYLCGVLCMFAYISVRPLIRKGIGSASRGYINLYATYTMWLVSAVFHHLPSLADLGMDVKADLTIMVSVFFMTFVLVALLNGLHYLAVSMKFMPPFLFSPGAGPREVLSAVAVNSMSVAVACSTHFSFCGNAGGNSLNWRGSFKNAMCSKWLGPVPSDDFPTFKKWVLYGEGSSELASNRTIFVDYPLDGRGSMPVAGKVISPVFMLWVTVFLMFLVNSLADSVAVQTMQVQHVSQLRRQTSVAALRKSGSSRIWYADKAKTIEWDKYSIASFQSSSAGSEASFDEHVVDRDNQPEFLPMVPWYSGTSADLVKTLFDITVSVKLFLGRFDMRTMLAATSSSKGSSPVHGDGLTFDHLMDREELWFDFCADTGDGGNSTYTVARALASPQLKVVRPTVKGEEQSVLLPRSDVLFLGGDLAYPGPSKETYQQRLFVPFQYALPPPSHDRRGRVVVHKPDIPKEWMRHEDGQEKEGDPLKEYEGPQCYAIPGNHDWHDGLETFIQQILHRGWLGGWLLPQESSYFAVRLPHNWWFFGVDLALVNDIDMCQYRYFARVVEKQLSKDSQVILMSHQPIWLEEWMRCTANSIAPNLRNLIRERLKGRCRIHIAGDMHFYLRHSLVPYQEGLKSRTLSMDVPYQNDSTYSEPPPTLNKIISQQKINNEDGELLKNSASKASFGCESEHCMPWGLDPEHLIVNGMGGAFLHPTHVFYGARFSGAMETGNIWEKDRLSTHKGFDDATLERRQSLQSPYDHGQTNTPRAGMKWKGVYHCMQEYPSSETSLALGQDNLYRFRLKNTRFDIVGALWYFLLVWSILPCCESTDAIVEAPNFLMAAYQFVVQVLHIIVHIFSEKYVSLIATLLMFGTCYGFAANGGVGCAQPPAAWTIAFNQGKPWLNGFKEDEKPAALRGYKVRTGGTSTKLLFACLHTITHLTVAVVLIQILELGLLTCIKHEQLGKEGYHSMYRWFKSFLDRHFPDPMGLQRRLSRVTLGMYPGVLKYLMAAYDVPEAVAVARTAICNSPGSWNELSRLQTLGYYLGMLGYYWLFAPPVMGLVFGLYLYISCCLFHLHADEAFSALRVQNHKGFTRLHITPNGDLEVYSLAVNVVPTSWKEDIKWRGPFGGGNPECPAHKAEYPSRWIPKARNDENLGYSTMLSEEPDFRVIDYLLVPRKQALRPEIKGRKSI